MKSEDSILIIDLDGTITITDNLVQFSFFMIRSKKQWKFLFFFPLIFLLKIKIINNRHFKILFAYLILKNQNSREIERYAEEFVGSNTFLKSINSDVMNFIESFNDCKKIILSANFSFLVIPISKRLNIQQKIFISLETNNNKYSGKIIDIIPYGKEKVEAIKPYLEKYKDHKTIGIADSSSDMPLLKTLDESFIVQYNKKSNITILKKI